jgi:FkbM family methyltransferase
MLKRRYLQVRKALALSCDPIFRRGLFQGVGASIEHRDLLSSLRLATVVDVGANVGQFTLLARGLFPDAQICAFEPLARPAARYRRLFAGDSKVHLHQFAIGPAPRIQNMHVSAQDDSSSLLPISDRQVEFAPGTQAMGSEEVRIAPLNQFLSAVDIAVPALLKLDVQGFELEALKGCEALLSRFDYIYVEASFLPLYEGQVLADELIEWLAGRDFHVRGACNPSYGDDRRIVQFDILLRRGRH